MALILLTLSLSALILWSREAASLGMTACALEHPSRRRARALLLRMRAHSLERP
jgi:hypothetical protein